jgi:hypothetical protein
MLCKICRQVLRRQNTLGVCSRTEKCRAERYRLRKEKYDFPKRSKEWREKNRPYLLDMQRRWNYKKKYGLTVEEVLEMIENQSGKCGICKSTDCRLGVDHNHQTGEIRGMLCNRCNTSLGWLESMGLDTITSYLLKKET